MKRIICFFFVLIQIGCSARPKMIRLVIDGVVNSSDFAKYNKMAVFPFTDAADAPKSSRKVQDLTSKALTNLGFEVTASLNEENQAPALEDTHDLSEMIKTGKNIGVDAIVRGEVKQYIKKVKVADLSYVDVSKTILPGQQSIESYVSISLQIIDVETGRMIYSGSGRYERGVKSSPQKLAKNIINNIILKWLKSPGTSGFVYNYKTLFVTKVYTDSPADKAGIKIGDKILKVNDIEMSKLSKLQQWTHTWGLPGEKVIFEIQRHAGILRKELIRQDRRKFIAD